ncbi:hypothetical protein TruAng_011811 [Truncatella angustata]|nr:hypothetical protein TruAng_011811 [Truncatella angustata]
MPAATDVVEFNQQDVTRTREPFQNRTASSMPPLSSANNATAATSRQQQQQQQQPKRWIKRYRTEVSASSASVLSTITAFPLDSVKTRLQTYPYKGFSDCVHRTYQSEGIRGFFRACFGAAGATAGSGITFIACPFELTKISAQVSVLMASQKNADPKCQEVAMSYHNKGTIMTLRNLVKHRGLSGMYTGLNLHLMRDTLGTGIYFATYESSKQLLTTFSGKDAHKNPIAVLVAGALCGIVSWALIYPIDSVKSIYQRNALMYSKGQKIPLPKIAFFRKDMYRGLGVSMARSAAVNAVFFSAFEFFKKKINKLEDIE